MIGSFLNLYRIKVCVLALAMMLGLVAMFVEPAAERASGGGPLTILGLCSALPATVAELLSRR